MKEIWKDIKGYEGLYEVSNFGRVKSLAKKSGCLYLKEKILKPTKAKNEYLYLSLSKNNIATTIRLHQLIWDHFGNKKRNGYKLQVDHIDGIRIDNRIENLQLLNCRRNLIKGHVLRGKKNKLPIGVAYYTKNKKRVRARIRINGRSVHLGCFDSVMLASQAYQKALRLTGE